MTDCVKVTVYQAILSGCGRHDRRNARLIPLAHDSLARGRATRSPILTPVIRRALANYVDRKLRPGINRSVGEFEFGTTWERIAAARGAATV